MKVTVMIEFHVAGMWGGRDSTSPPVPSFRNCFLCRPCVGPWGYNREQDRQGPCPRGAQNTVRDMPICIMHVNYLKDNIVQWSGAHPYSAAY